MKSYRKINIKEEREIICSTVVKDIVVTLTFGVSRARHNFKAFMKLYTERESGKSKTD